MITRAEKAIRKRGERPTRERVLDYIVPRQAAALERDEGLLAAFVNLAMTCVDQDVFSPGDRGWHALSRLGYVDENGGAVEPGQTAGASDSRESWLASLPSCTCGRGGSPGRHHSPGCPLRIYTRAEG